GASPRPSAGRSRRSDRPPRTSATSMSTCWPSTGPAGRTASRRSAEAALNLCVPVSLEGLRADGAAVSQARPRFFPIPKVFDLPLQVLGGGLPVESTTAGRSPGEPPDGPKRRKRESVTQRRGDRSEGATSADTLSWDGVTAA